MLVVKNKYLVTAVVALALLVLLALKTHAAVPAV